MGVASGPTVIRHLKSVFPSNANGRLNLQTDNFVFRIYTRLTPLIFLILGGLIFWQRMSGEHINCYAPPDHSDIRAQAVNQYCFVTGTYTVTGYSTDLKNVWRRLPYPGVGPHVLPSQLNGGGSEIKYHLYFQWVPFVLLVQAMLLMLPRHIWKGILKDSLSRYCESIVSSDMGDNAGIPESITPAARRFFKNLKSHNSASRGFIYCELLSLVLALGCLALSDKLLTGSFLSLGYNWLHYFLFGHNESYLEAMNMTTNPLDLVFPKMSKCEFRMFGPGGGIINYDILCVMTLNVLHDKVFLFQWLWLWLIIDLQVINLIYRLVLRSSGDLRWSRIMARVESAFIDGSGGGDYDDGTDPDNKFYQFKQDAKQVVVSLSYSDWFMLQAIAHSVDPVKFTGFLQNLIYLRKKVRDRQYGLMSDTNGGGINERRRTSGRNEGDTMMMVPIRKRKPDRQDGSPAVTSPLMSRFPHANGHSSHDHHHRERNLYSSLPSRNNPTITIQDEMETVHVDVEGRRNSLQNTSAQDEPRISPSSSSTVYYNYTTEENSEQPPPLHVHFPQNGTGSTEDLVVGRHNNVR